MEKKEKKNTGSQDDKGKRKRQKKLLSDIRTQLEFYFSDANLRKDRFLSIEMKKSKLGYVPLDIIASFNRMRALTLDRSLIIKAIKKSDLLEVNDSSTSVRRKVPPENPQYDPDDCTIYVECLPKEADHDWIKRTFEYCGKVMYVSLPRYKTTGDIKGFAFVEYGNPDEAKRACEILNNPLDEVGPPGIFPKTKKGKYIAINVTDPTHDESLDISTDTLSILDRDESLDMSTDTLSLLDRSQIETIDEETESEIRDLEVEQSVDGEGDSVFQEKEKVGGKRKRKNTGNRANAGDAESRNLPLAISQMSDVGCVGMAQKRKHDDSDDIQIGEQERNSSIIEMKEHVQEHSKTSKRKKSRSENSSSEGEKKGETIEGSKEEIGEGEMSSSVKKMKEDVQERSKKSKRKRSKSENSSSEGENKGKTIKGLKDEIEKDEEKRELKEQKVKGESKVRKNSNSRKRKTFDDAETTKESKSLVVTSLEGTKELKIKEKESKMKKAKVSSSVIKEGDEEVDTKKKKKKRLRQKKSKEEPQLFLRVISKADWLGLKHEYLSIQKICMKKTKEALRNHWRQTSTAQESSEHPQKEETSANPKSTEPIFVEGVVARLSSQSPISSRKEIKEQLNLLAPVAYVDLKDGDIDGYVRFKTAEGAQSAVSEFGQNATDIHLTPLTGEEEKKYWEKLRADREQKLKSKGKSSNNKRGVKKILEKVERIKRSSNHVRFDED